jgi:hypothetical protein
MGIKITAYASSCFSLHIENTKRDFVLDGLRLFLDPSSKLLSLTDSEHSCSDHALYKCVTAWFTFVSGSCLCHNWSNTVADQFWSCGDCFCSQNWPTWMVVHVVEKPGSLDQFLRQKGYTGTPNIHIVFLKATLHVRLTRSSLFGSVLDTRLKNQQGSKQFRHFMCKKPARIFSSTIHTSQANW